MDIPTTLFLMIIASVVAGVLIPPTRKLLDSLCRYCLLQIRKLNEERNHRAHKRNEAENAVRDALKSWDYAENFREAKSEYVQAYGGYYPTVQEEIECWKDVLAKCKRAVAALEQNNETDRARWFSRNVSIATNKLEGLRCVANNSNVTTIVIGIDEAKRRKYDAKLANNTNRGFVNNWKVFSTQDVEGV